MRELIACLLKLFASIAIIIYMQPNSLIFYVFILAIYYLVMNAFINVSRQIRRWETTTRSPLYSHLDESLCGVSTIRYVCFLLTFVSSFFFKINRNISISKRAYKKVDETIATMQSWQNKNNRCYWYFISGKKWLDVYLEMLTSLVVMVVTFQFILARETTAAAEGETEINFSQSNLDCNQTHFALFKQLVFYCLMLST